MWEHPHSHLPIHKKIVYKGHGFSQRISHSSAFSKKARQQDSIKKAQQYQEGPVRSLHIETDSQSVTEGVIWSVTAKGVGLSVTVQKGVRRRLTPNYHHDIERKPVIAVPGACRSIVRHRSSVPRAPYQSISSSTAAADQILPVFQMRRRTPHSSSTLIRCRPPTEPDNYSHNALRNHA